MTLLDASPLAPAADAVAASVRSVYHRLDACPDLRPGAEVNEIFADLVDLVVTTPDDCATAVLADSAVQGVAARLRELCAQGETELERAWARRIAHGRNPQAELSSFPYFDNYRLLGGMEGAALRAQADRPIRSLAFVGSGPLPLSSLVLARELRATVTNIDRDPDALDASRAVAGALGRHDLAFRLADASEADLSGFDAVVMAALVGATPAEKSATLCSLRATLDPGTLILIRSARGLRTLLYPEVDVDGLHGFDVLTVLHPAGEVINSAIVARAAEPVSQRRIPLPAQSRSAAAGWEV